MKRMIHSFTALSLAAALLFNSVPFTFTSQAEGKQKVSTIRDVKLVKTDVSFWGVKPYFVYEVDGVEYDSRYSSEKLNAMAWKAMNTADRRTVNKQFWQLSRRQEAFGSDFAIEMGKWSDEALGYTAVRDALNAKWEDRYLSSLKPIFGDDNFQLHYDGIANFPDGSAAYQVLNNYKDEPEAKEFVEKYTTSTNLMTWGKTYCYDAAFKAILQARAMGVNAMSKELISIIVSNFMTPSVTLMGPTKPIGMATDLYTKLFDLFDSKANVTSKIQEFVIGKTVSTDDAVKAINKLDEYVSNRLAIAQECYGGACRIREELESEAESVLTAIENRHPEDEINRQKYEAEKEATGVLVNNPSAEVDETTSGYSGTYLTLDDAKTTVESKEAELNAELAKEDSDLGRVQNLRAALTAAEENYANKKAEEDAKIEQKINKWVEDMNEKTDRAIKSAGFEIFPDDYEFTDAEIEEYDLENAGIYYKMNIASNIDHCDYYHYSGIYTFADDTHEYSSLMYYYWSILPPSALRLYDDDLSHNETHLKNNAAKIRALAGVIPGLFDTYYSKYQEIAAMGKGYDDVVNAVPSGEEEGEVVVPYYSSKVYQLDSIATEAFSRIQSIPNDLTDADKLERYVDEVRKGDYADAVEKSNDFCKVLKQNANDYNEIKADFDLAFVEYCNDLKVAKDLYAQVPEYVKNLNTNPNMPYDIDATLKNIVKSQSNPKYYLKNEAKKLDDLYDRFVGIKEELNTDQAYLSCYIQQLNYLEGTFSAVYADPDNPYASKEYKNSELLKLFEVSGSLSLLEDDLLCYEEQLVAAGSDGTIYTSDETLLSEYGITYDENRAFNRIPSLTVDFSGGTDLHAAFVAAYNELRNRKGTILRQIKAGDDSLFMEVSGRMRSAYDNCLSYTYNSRYAGLGNGKVIDMYKELYEEGGIVADIYQVWGKYIPVTKIGKGGKQNLRLMSGEEDGNSDAEDLTVAPGGSGRLIVGVEPFDATDKELVWSSLDPEIAQVDQDGVVTGIEEGTATIQCIASDTPTEMAEEAIGDISIDAYEVPDDFILFFNVTVDKNAPAPEEVQAVNIDADKDTIEAGEMAQVTAIVTPEDASAYLTWSVEPEGIISISAERDGEYGTMASGWRVYARGLSIGKAKLTATADNGAGGSINITVSQKALTVCDDLGNSLGAFNTLAEVKDFISRQWIDSPDNSYRIRLNEDLTEDESELDYGVSSADYGENAGKVSFDLNENTLTVTRSEYCAMLLQRGSVFDNGTLAVTGPDGLQTFGEVLIDKVRAERLYVNQINDEICTINEVTVSKLFGSSYGSICFVHKLNAEGDLDCMNDATLAVDVLNVSGKTMIKDDALLLVNERGVLGGGIIISNGGEAAYIAKNIYADLSINGNITSNAEDMPLYFGITSDRFTQDRYEQGGRPAVMSLSEQTLLYNTSLNSVSKYVKVWQPKGAEGAANSVVYAGGAVFAAALDEEIEVPEVKPVTGLLLDKTSVSIGTDHEVRVKVTALCEDANLVGRPPVIWSENKNGRVIAITDIDYDEGIVTVVGVGAGSAVLTATTTDGSKKKAGCTVKVGTSIESVNIRQKKNIDTVEAGKKLTLTAEILPKKPAPIVKTLIWESDDPSIAAVDSKGNVTGISEGTATITARPANELYDATAEDAQYAVTVTKASKAIAVSSISIKNPLSGALSVGKSATLKAFTRDTAKNKDVALNNKSIVFYSSDDSILSVTPTGKMTAIKEGEADITAVSLADPSITATVNVSTYVAVKKIVLNSAKGKVKKGSMGVIAIAQWTPDNSTNKEVLWTATGADGSTKAGNIQAVKLAVLHEGETIADLSDKDFMDARTTPVVTDGNDRIVYKTLVATKKCVITAVTSDGNKKAKYTLVSTGEVTSLSLKTTKTLIATKTGYATTIKAGKSLKPGTVIQAEYGADKTIRWTSNNQYITVKNGTIKVDKSAEKGSRATITASAAGGKHTVTLEVTVE